MLRVVWYVTLKESNLMSALRQTTAEAPPERSVSVSPGRRDREAENGNVHGTGGCGCKHDKIARFIRGDGRANLCPVYQAAIRLATRNLDVLARVNMSPLIRMDHQALQEEVGRRWWQHATAGDLEQAWRQSDRLLQARVDLSHLPRFFRPIWDGRPFSGAGAWLKCWRGLGDAIHFIRYVTPLRARCARLVVEAPDELHRLFANVPGIDDLVALDEDRRIGPEFVQVESTELPYALRTTLASIPQTVPYLRVKPAGQVPKDGHLHNGF
jgi:hypothetical protein